MPHLTPVLCPNLPPSRFSSAGDEEGEWQRGMEILTLPMSDYGT